jgi:3-oxoacyl-[acyl-carrier-protein] synthase-1
VQQIVNPLIVTHYTGVNCLGEGTEAWWRALRDRRSGLRACAFEDAVLDTFVGQVARVEHARIREDLAAFDCRNNRLAQLGLEQDGFAPAVVAARERYGPHRIAVVLGTSTSGVGATERAYRHRDPVSGALPADFHYPETQNTFSLAAFVRRSFDLRGPAHVVSTACSSSAKVFSSAARLIDAGLADAAVVGGVDSLCLTTLYGFRSLELLSSTPCRPFDPERTGISIGEGAGFALLEPAGDGVALVGFGESCDAYHMSTPHPEGLGARLAMERALASASITPEDIGYINVHGTATRTNDVAEGRAVRDVFGPDTPCSATKGAHGHLLGAAGITEAIVAIMSLERGWLPGTANTRALDVECGCHVLLEGEPADARYVLSNSFGFGGNNCSLIFRSAH